MAHVGLKMVKLALIDDNEKIISGAAGLSETGILAIDSTYFGTQTANITNLEGSVVKVAGNNLVQDSYTNPSAPQIAMTVNNLFVPIKNQILGNESDGAGGYVYSGAKPKVAVLIETETIDRKNSIFFGFRRTQVSAASENVQTDTDTASTRQNDVLTFTALGVVDWNGGEPYKNYYSGDELFKEETMLADVFPGAAVVAPPAG